MKPEYVQCYRSDGPGRSETVSAGPEWAILGMELFNGGVEQSEKKISVLLHCEKLDIEAIRNNMKRVPSCCELLPKSPSRNLKNEGLLMEDVEIDSPFRYTQREEQPNAIQSVLY